VEVTNDTGARLFTILMLSIDAPSTNRRECSGQFPQGMAINVRHLKFSQGLEYR
jgi:hypothetical protein